ncbi:efflux RND transporter periplasmic adaptor subunit [Ohtaekwangia koreensis]|uniref:RND family efflux transporter, MFP subunit n=1 Tax=Ohtaekwangia koreensis TaxID=688867 RepID=A0A1T5JKH7_9BACT|nr:efflux RND transporter periplasmic adaptor subunit [Ohtaekwangia koreensis]SKC52097.1 RND family efflux transporter, MFP subunit [Ohtaekwangia koreensis]
MKYTPFLLVMLLIASCTGNREQPQADQDSAVAVEVRTIATQKISGTISLSGTIEGKTTVRLGFLVPGKVEYIAKKEGELITQGQLLSQLEPTNYTLAQKLSTVQADATKDELDRLARMYKQGSVSESDYTQASFSWQQADLQQKLQQKNLTDTKLYSPLTGILLNKQVEVGEIIAAGTPLFVVADIKNVTVSAFIPEGELHQIKLGQSAEISIAALNKNFTGKVTEVGAIADATSRAFTIKIEIENNGMLIRPGMIAEVKLAGNQNETGILVPVELIVRDTDNQSYIYVSDRDKRKAFKRKVSLGKMLENKIQVISGLSAGEIIVTAGQSKLSDGINITVVK